MEEDVLQALQSRIVYLPGSFDRHGRIIFIVNINNDLQSWSKQSLELAINYLKRSLSEAILLKGITVIVDAQKSTARITRQHARYLYELFKDLSVSLFLVKSEGFWEKHVETCTKSNTKEEPIVLSKARLAKYFNLSNLPEELGGTLQINYDLWLQQRKSIDEFEKFYNKILNAIDGLRLLLQNTIKTSVRSAEAEIELKKCNQIYATVHDNIETVIEMGNRILTRFNEIYAQSEAVIVATSPAIGHLKRISNNAIATELIGNKIPLTITSSSSNNFDRNISMKSPMPPDLNCERVRLELRLNDIEKRQTKLRKLWLELLQNIHENRELAILEERVAFITNWILTKGEQMLNNNQQAIGADVKACEQLRTQHDNLEMECRDTYGFYGELLYKIENFHGNRDTILYRDLISQQEFMQFVCRSFANRLERRRNILITSLRFFRLVNEYFERTSEIFETLVMDNKMEDFTKAANCLQQLKDSQHNLVLLERDLIKEGEKLSDMLSMPIKDALGRDLHIDYSLDICNVHETLEAIKERRHIFNDSVELQKLTLEQLTHINVYESDARMAIKWLNDLFNVMIKCHAHVGCNIHEIQVQKDELLTFQETGKSIYNYGCQLLEAAQALRNTCKLNVIDVKQMQQQLQHIWYSLQAISQEHMTRLRVSAVFHRSVEDYCRQLKELKDALLKFCLQRRKHSRIQQHQSQHTKSALGQTQTQTHTQTQGHTQLQSHSQSQSQSHSQSQNQMPPLPQRSSSSGISSESDSQPSMDENLLKPIKVLCKSVSTAATIANTSRSVSIQNSNASVIMNNENIIMKLMEQRDQLRKYLIEREQLLVEVGRMVRLGRLLKTRLKEPFMLDAITGKSVVIEEIPSEMNTPSPTVENVNTTTTSTTNTSSNSNSSTVDGNNPMTIINFSTDSTKIIIKPIQNNALACNAITEKLTEIAEVAESLDAVIRDIHDHAPCMELDSIESTQNTSNCNNGNGDKKIVTTTTTAATVRSSSCEDWHSRSTEDDSFVTASEGNFTPFSQTSSSYRTASARTNSSVISCDKNNSPDLDDMTFTNELISPLNTSFEGSEQSFIIGPIKSDIKNTNNSNNNDNTIKADVNVNVNQKNNKSMGKQFMDNSCQTECDLIENGSSNVKAIATTAPFITELNDDSTADIEELHSEPESMTPTPTPTSPITQKSMSVSMPISVPIIVNKSNGSIESDIDLEISTIQDAPTSLAIITETRHIDSVTPEVSLCSVHSSVVDEPHVQIQQQRFIKTNANNWRHNKYYENITKQTIKGFL